MPGLYIVATPIGNLGDITPRAAAVLARADVIAAEDTRVTAKLLAHLGLRVPMTPYHDHSDERARAALVARMADEVVVLVSDAGTPLISDPGYKLVRDARAAGRAITTLPGPCAAIAAITLSGLPNDRFLFAGFLPSKEKARRDALTDLSGIDATLVFYETAPRLLKALAAIGDALPEREIAVARELTKLHEELRRGLAPGLIAWFEKHPPKGEIVLMIGPPVETHSSDADIEALLWEALDTLKPSQAAAQVAKATGEDRKALYARALEMRRE